MKKTRLTPEEFIREWQKADNLRQLSELWGLPQRYLSTRAAFYRRIGIKLRRMPHPPRGLDVAKLSALAQSLVEV